MTPESCEITKRSLNMLKLSDIHLIYYAPNADPNHIQVHVYIFIQIKTYIWLYNSG